ncbi:MAG: hypothetical protein M5U01_19555 [Ardenticatenaceae bacterium]|nr:hypothetical protein [Ardenticatenaceae bacterium]
MINKRIQVYTDPETKRRIELAAAKYNMALTEYCIEAIQEKLREDDMLEEEHIEIQVKPPKDEDLVRKLSTLRESILKDRGGKLIDVDAILHQVREERDDEILGMR